MIRTMLFVLLVAALPGAAQSIITCAGCHQRSLTTHPIGLKNGPPAPTGKGSPLFDAAFAAKLQTAHTAKRSR